MSGLYNHGMNVPDMAGSNMMDPGYPVYDTGFGGPYPRLSGPPTHFDGVAFWYNPSNNDQLYDRDPNHFKVRGVALPPSAMEAAAIKHRRTRSGCFTCRSRRVKVGNSFFRLDATSANLKGSVTRLDQSVTVRLSRFLPN